MKRQTTTSYQPRNFRRGLAPLELVLWLPVLLFVAALMVNVGTMTAWRVRGEVVARDAVWRTRWPHNGANEPRPEPHVWPAGARMEVVGEPQIAQLDDPAINHEVVRGPLPGGFEVQPLFQPDQGMRRGAAEITREYPLLAKLGPYHSGEIAHPLLDDRWQLVPMGVPANVYRRTKVLYEMPKTDPRLPEAFVQSIMDILSMPNHDDLGVLDRDEEVRQYTGGYVDWHPRINPAMCELDPEIVREQQVERLIDTTVGGRTRPGLISRLPERMTQFYLNMYRSAQQQLEDQLAQLQGSPRPDSGAMQQTQAEISSLQQNIMQLEQFQQTLRDGEP